MIDQIKTYLKKGFNVIPVNQDKTPACDWKNFQFNKIEDFRLFTTNCLAIVCGKISDNLEVLDFDNHSGTASQNLTAYIENPLVKEICEHYNLPIIQTQSGGYHLYYRCETINGNQKLASVKLNGKMDTIIEIRGEGGYILAPPSPNYKLIRNKIEDLQYISESERIILHEVAKSFNEFIKPTQNFKPKLDNESPGTIYDAKPESIHEAKNILKNAGWSELNNFNWCRPGKNKGVSATFGKVAPNIFYCFTSNSEHFENDKAYTPFAIKSIIEFKGNFSECAKELAKRYGLNNHKTEEKKEHDLKSVLKSCLIDNSLVITKPPTILAIRNQFDSKEIPLMSLGNISVTKGFAKSKKTLLSSIFAASLVHNYEIFHCIVPTLPENKRNVIYIDTEQSKWDSKILNYKIVKMSKTNGEYLAQFNFRGKSSIELLELITYILETFSNIGIIFIDQVADMVKSLNSEEEATDTVKFLEMATEKYNIHINCVVHINKLNDYAQGWLGTQLMKKAQTIINVSKDKRVKSMGIVEPDLCRGEDFEPFVFYVNKDGFPELADRNVLKELKEIDI